MPSTFSWLDYSDQHRRQMLDVIDLFREQETRDELGIGTVRDAFADMLFPGTSTIQTRARYFLFVPWVYRQLERKRTTSDQVRSKARKAEVTLIHALLTDGDHSGLIGRQAKEALQRLPSSVYWQGLRLWGICLYQGSQDQYQRSLDNWYRWSDRAARESDGEGLVSPNWHSGLPEIPDGFPESASFQLETEEGRYLRDRILARVPRTLIAFLVDTPAPDATVDFPWEHPLFASFPEHIQEQLLHARNFSEAIHGAAYLYNLMLAEKRGAEDLEQQYRELIADWAAKLEVRISELRSWDQNRFWKLIDRSGARVTPQTRLFVNIWLDVALSDNPSGSALSDQARKLIGDRERALKRGLARLDNSRSLELWNGAAGTGALDYRWRQTQVILRDIASALFGEG